VYNSACSLARARDNWDLRQDAPFRQSGRSAGWTKAGRSADVFETRLGAVGMIICYDGDFPELCRLLAVKGAEIIVRPLRCFGASISGI